MSKAMLKIDYRCLPDTNHLHIYIAAANDKINAADPKAGKFTERGNIIKVDKNDAKKRSVNFGLTDLLQDTKYYIEIIAFTSKKTIIDKSYISAVLKEKEASIMVKVISGWWKFKKPIAFNSIFNDPVKYEGIYLAPLEKNGPIISHDCFLYYDSGRKKTHLHPFCFATVAGVPYMDSLFDGKKIRGLFFINGRYESSAGELNTQCLDPDINKIVQSPIYFLSEDKIKLWMFEGNYSIADEKTVDDNPDAIRSAIKRLEEAGRIAGTPIINPGSSPMPARNLHFIVFHRPCPQCYKAFCHEYEGKKITIALDKADLFLYQTELTRQIKES